MDEEYFKVRLDNGMWVLLKEIHTAPLVSAWMWYRVGSRDEAPGITGASHWVEHMQFKGTPRFPGKKLDKDISRQGGYWNAMTYIDWTTYFATMPASKIDLILRLEADRMHNSYFDPDEIESERSVIISERQGNANDPGFLLAEQVVRRSFDLHPYRHQVIGELTDLENISREQLYAHYQKFYMPNNAVLTVAGAFNFEDMITRIRELFEFTPAGYTPERPACPEPASTAERRVEVEGPGETALVEVSYHAPAGNQADFFACMVLDSLLTGASNLNLFGGGISNKTSRLYQALVEKNLAVAVGGGLQATIDPYLYHVMLTVHPNRKPEKVISVLDAQIARLQDKLAPTDELQKAVKQAKALFAYGSESITNQAFWLGFSEMFDSYDWFLDYIDQLAAVTPEDVQRVAQTYLVPANRTVGIYRPNGNGGGA
ncbi:MAG: pitrilysin family protein [Chloroflexota bacterium]